MAIRGAGRRVRIFRLLGRNYLQRALGRNHLQVICTAEALLNRGVLDFVCVSDEADRLKAFFKTPSIIPLVSLHRRTAFFFFTDMRKFCAPDNIDERYLSG